MSSSYFQLQMNFLFCSLSYNRLFQMKVFLYELYGLIQFFIKPGSRKSPMLVEFLSIVIQGENSQTILLMRYHRQRTSALCEKKSFGENPELSSVS